MFVAMKFFHFMHPVEIQVVVNVLDVKNVDHATYNTCQAILPDKRERISRYSPTASKHECNGLFSYVVEERQKRNDLHRNRLTTKF